MAWNGYGEVAFEAQTQSLRMRPAAVRKKSETRSALVLSKQKLGEYSIEITYTNLEPTRSDESGNLRPNAWELFWLFFDYRVGNDGKKEANYLIIKPNGTELGRAFGELGQSFFKTASRPHVGYGHVVQLNMDRTSKKVLVSANGYSFDSGSLNPFAGNLPYSPGKIGLYTEDADVRIHRVCLKTVKP